MAASTRLYTLRFDFVDGFEIVDHVEADSIDDAIAKTAAVRYADAPSWVATCVGSYDRAPQVALAV